MPRVGDEGKTPEHPYGRIGFFDGTCPKCKTKISWSGTIRNRPACPRCKYVVPTRKTEEDEKVGDNS